MVDCGGGAAESVGGRQPGAAGRGDPQGRGGGRGGQVRSLPSSLPIPIPRVTVSRAVVATERDRAVTQQQRGSTSSRFTAAAAVVPRSVSARST